MRMIIKICAVFFAVILLLLLGLTVFSQTPLFRNILQQQLIRRANTNFNAELSIGRIEGNLVSHLSVQDIRLTYSDEKIAEIRRLDIRFLPRKLVQKQIAFQAILIDEPIIRIQQDTQGRWNFSQLLKKQAQDSNTPSTFQWTFAIENAHVENGDIEISPLDTSTVYAQHFKNIFVRTSLHFQDDKLNILLQEFKLQVEQSQFLINSLACRVDVQAEQISVNDLLLKTAASHLSGSFAMDSGEYQFAISAEHLDIEDIRSFVPSFPILALNPKIKINGRGNEDMISAKISLQEKEQHIYLQATLDNLKQLASYRIDAQFTDFRLNRWFGYAPALNPMNGTIQLTGQGTDIASVQGQVLIQLENFTYSAYHLDSLYFYADVKDQQLAPNLKIFSKMGNLAAHGKISHLKNPIYQLDIETSGMDLAQVLKNPELSSHVNMQANINGRGITEDSIHVKLDLKIADSDFKNIPITKFRLNTEIENSRIDVDSLYLYSPLAELHLRGAATRDSLLFADTHMKPGNLALLDSIIAIPPIQADGWIDARVAGKWDSPAIQGSTNLHITFNDIQLDSLVSTIHIKPTELKGDIDLAIRQISIGELILSNFKITGARYDSLFSSILSISLLDTNSVTLESDLALDSLITINIKHFSLQNGKKQWLNKASDTRVKIKDQFYHIQNLQLMHDNKKLMIDGFIDLAHKQNLTIRMDNFLFADLPIIHFYPKPHGTISTEFSITGYTENPNISALLRIDDLQFSKYHLGNLSMQGDLKNEKLTVDMDLIKNSNSYAAVNAYTSLPITLKKPQLKLAEPIDVKADIRNINIGFLQAFSPQFSNIQGILDLHLQTPDLLHRRDLQGYLRIKDGLVNVAPSGTPYTDIQIASTFQNNKVTLESLKAKTGNGSLQLKGFAELDENAQEFIKQFQLDLTAKQFIGVTNRDMEIIFDSNIQLSGTPQKPIFNGETVIRRSKLYLPALQGTSAKPELNPRLVQKNNDEKMTTIRPQIPTALQNLKGRATIRIPRNTWIRNEEMNIELMGDLEIVKQNSHFELFGDIETVRGSYQLYGRRFNIQTGEISFQGGAEFNPQVNMDAIYSFRNIDGDKSKLLLNISGKLMEPQIQFTLDEEQIEEADGFSFLLFGRSVNQLSHGERQQMAQSTDFNGATVTRLLAGQLTKKLGRSLGNRFNLDVIEFTGDENWRSASVVVGKYLTNDLFLSYEKEFSFNSAETLPERVSLEYEITKYLFLQATKGDAKSTGFDFIWKWEK